MRPSLSLKYTTPYACITGNATWGPECVAYGSGLKGGGVGQHMSFTIQARDPYGNNITDSDGIELIIFCSRFCANLLIPSPRCYLSAQFVVTFTRDQATTYNVDYNITQDLTDLGKFIVVYSTTTAGQYSVAVSVDNRYASHPLVSYRLSPIHSWFGGAERSREARSRPQ